MLRQGGEIIFHDLFVLGHIKPEGLAVKNYLLRLGGFVFPEHLARFFKPHRT